jgi:hypothetical protein
MPWDLYAPSLEVCAHSIGIVGRKGQPLAYMVSREGIYVEAFEPNGSFIEGGWLVFALLVLAWVVLLIKKRLDEENRIIRELENQRVSIESLVKLSQSLADAQPDPTKPASSQFDKTPHTETLAFEQAGDAAGK